MLAYANTQTSTLKKKNHRCFSLRLSASILMTMIFYILSNRHLTLLAMLKFVEQYLLNRFCCFCFY